MSKVTLDRDTFKALASDTRLDILRTLDGRKMNLTEIAAQTKLNKATLHEHLSKLAEAGLVKKKEREGHKWVYYKLSWKGENILHPENTRIVIMFTMTFVALGAGFVQLYLYLKGTVFAFSDSLLEGEKSPMIDGNETLVNGSGIADGINQVPENTRVFLESNDGMVNALYQNPLFLYIAVGCFVLFIVLLSVSLWRFWINKTPKL